MSSPLTAAEAVIGGTILYMSSDVRIQAMAAENDAAHFIEGCKGPWFEQLTAQALVSVRDASSAADGASHAR